MDNLPKDKNLSFTVGGISFANRAEFDNRVSQDAEGLAELLYDIWREEQHTTLDKAPTEQW